MKVFKYIIVILTLFVMSCNLGRVSEQAEVDSSRGAGIRAYINFPDWDAPKVSGSRVVDPNSTNIELYSDFGSNFVDSVDFTPSDGVDIISFSGLEARTYEAGELVINIKNVAGVILTEGENLEAVTLTYASSTAIEFSSIPYSFSTLYEYNTFATQTLADGNHIFFGLDVTAQEIYEIYYERYSATGDVDVFIFDELGRLVTEEVIVEGLNESRTVTFAPDYTGLYYVAFQAYAGSGSVDFYYDFSYSPDTGTIAVSGTVYFPSSFAGDTVFIEASYSGVDVAIETQVQRDGDTSLDYIITGIPDYTSNISVWAVVDNDDSSTVANISGNLGDYTGSYDLVFDADADHIYDINIQTEELLGVEGTVSFPAAIPVGTNLYVAKIYDNGELTGGFGSFSAYTSFSTYNYSTIADAGTYRVVFIADLDNSGNGASLYDSNFYTIVTGGDYYFVSDLFTITDTTVYGVNGAADTAAIISGSVILPQQHSLFYYTVYADDNNDSSDGVYSIFEGTYYDSGYDTDYFTYSLVVPAGVDTYISSHIDLSDYTKELSNGDYFGYINEYTPAIYYNGYFADDLYISDHEIDLTGLFYLPAGYYADGVEYAVGIIDQDIWSSGFVPAGTGYGGYFSYTLNGIELGEDLEVVLYIDMDGNGLESSPNYGDIVGYVDGVTLDNSMGESLDFTDTFVAEPTIFGTVSSSMSFSYNNFQIWIDGEVEKEDIISGTTLSYDISMVDQGDRTISVVVDYNGDGIFGNSGDWVGHLDVTVYSYDMTITEIVLNEVSSVVEGIITFPSDFTTDTVITVQLTNLDTGNIYEYYGSLYADDDEEDDFITYRFENVEDGTYSLSIQHDYGYESFYPYGEDVYNYDEIYITGDILDLNYTVDSSVMF